MKASKVAYEIIKKYEGLKLNSYKCPAGVWTIGYGHTATTREGMKITEKEAERLLEKDVEEIERTLNACIKVSLTQNQYDALISLAYNIGASKLCKSKLMQLVNINNFKEAAEEFLKFNKARINGVMQELKGLNNRREAERKLFLGEK